MTRDICRIFEQTSGYIYFNKDTLVSASNNKYIPLYATEAFGFKDDNYGFNGLGSLNSTYDKLKLENGRSIICYAKPDNAVKKNKQNSNFVKLTNTYYNNELNYIYSYNRQWIEINNGKIVQLYYHSIIDEDDNILLLVVSDIHKSSLLNRREIRSNTNSIKQYLSKYCTLLLSPEFIKSNLYYEMSNYINAIMDIGMKITIVNSNIINDLVFKKVQLPYFDNLNKMNNYLQTVPIKIIKLYEKAVNNNNIITEDTINSLINNYSNLDFYIETEEEIEEDLSDSDYSIA